MLKMSNKKAALYLIFFPLFLFTACNNFFAGSAAAGTTTGEITDTTYLFITPLFDTDKRQGPSRTAFPEFDSSTCQTFSYSLTSEILSSEVEGAYAPGSGQVIYSIRSDSFTNKSFTFYVKNSEGNIIASASKNLSITNPGTALTENLVFSFYRGSAENPAANGYVNLVIQHNNTNFTFENPKVYSLYDNSEVTGITCSVSGNSCTIQTTAAGIAPGLYEVRTYVKNASNVPVQYFMQKIEVWPSLTTENWYLPGGDLYQTYTLSGDGTNTFYVRGSDGTLYSSGILPGALAANDSNAGTILSPLASLSAALAKCTQAAEYTIYIDGRITVTSTIDSSFKPSKVTIEGITGNETDILDGNSTGRVLWIRNSTYAGEVIIKNLKITKGRVTGNSNDGAGLMINNGCTVKLEGLWLDDNQTNHFGGGISNVGNCFIYGSTVIGSKTPTQKATEEDNSNSAHYGGGIYNKGKLFLGYKGFVSGSDTELDAEAWTGGIYCNYATEQGGGIHNDGGEITFNSGTISFNDAGLYGGAISSAIRSPKYPKLNISSSASIPAGIDRSNNIYVINGAPITVNAALTSHDSSNPIVIRQAADNIQVISVATGSGLNISDVKSAFEIYNSNYIIDNNGICRLIPGTLHVTPGSFPGNYVCQWKQSVSGSTRTINIIVKDSSGHRLEVGTTAGTLNNVSVDIYEGADYIKTETGLSFTYPSYLDPPSGTPFYVRFDVQVDATTVYSYDYWPDGGYWIGSKTPDQAKNVGDIIFNDGSAMAYTDFDAITDTSVKNEKKTAAIALIFYKGTDLNSDDDDGSPDTTTTRTLGVGLKHDISGLAWCINGAAAHSKNISTIQCTPSGSAGSFTFTGDKNGSDNLSQIADFLQAASDATDDTTGEEAADRYQAFYFAKNYKKQKIGSETASRIPTISEFENGWYLPSIAELFQIYVNGKGESKVFDIDAASQALGGDTFGTSAYWSSSQFVSGDSLAYGFYFSTRVCNVSSKYGTFSVCAIRAF